jgi:hypothetical protein
MKTISLLKHPTEPEINSLGLIKSVVNNRPTEGFTIEDINTRLRILKAVDAVNPESTVLELEDSDHTALKKLLPAMRWGIVDPFIPQFADSINNA